MSPIIVWFRQDLRLADNPALAHAAASGRPLLCLYILDDETSGRWRFGGASRWWLDESLAALGRELALLGGRLVLRRGPAEKILPAVVREISAGAVVWNRCYEPYAVARDTALKTHLTNAGIETKSCNAALLVEPWQIATKAGAPFRVFTPFWKALRQREVTRPAPVPRTLTFFAGTVAGDALAAWRLAPIAPNWADGFRPHWAPGEAGAAAKLDDFLIRAVDYPDLRDRPDLVATSRLSPHLHWGEISPRQAWHAIRAKTYELPDDGEKYLSELAWREFAYHLLYHFPTLPDEPLDAGFAEFPWTDDPAAFEAWSKGQTGIPIVDAGMRELWQTGWMHNRVRMIVASFLTKHLLIPWQRGEAWFWDTLLDADLANNAAGWQWVAGCGADAAPFFRIFNPVLQGEKFDPEGDYVRRFVPELTGLPARHIHRPWQAPAIALAEAGLRPGRNYPLPVVDLAAGRARALAAFRARQPARKR